MQALYSLVMPRFSLKAPNVTVSLRLAFRQLQIGVKTATAHGGVC